MRALEGRTIALLESRRGVELAALVRQSGGTPVCAPSVQEVERPEDIRRFADDLANGLFDVIVFLTGAGVTAVLDDARRRGVLDETVASLGRTTLACRGPKPLGVLRKHALTPALTSLKPHTSQELLDALASLPLDGRRVALVHYGERSPAASDALRRRGAVVDDVCVYEWTLPEDERPLVGLIEEVLAGRVDAVLVTSQIQFRHLSAMAHGAGRGDALREALRVDVVVGVIGPICADAIRQAGIIPDVMPESPNLPSLVRALGDYFELMAG
jgi:uroporphyrinogen-III synthase